MMFFDMSKAGDGGVLQGEELVDLITMRLIRCGCLAFIIMSLQGCASSKAPSVQEITQQGMAFMEEGLAGSALAAFEKALKSDPTYVPAHVGLGSVYQVYGDFELALRYFEQAIELDPSAYEPRYRYGWVKHLTGNLDEAIENYKKALIISPNHFEPNFQLGGAYLQKGRLTDALPYAKRATELNSTNQTAWANLATTYGALERYADAVNAYRQAIELGELSEHILMGLANAHIKLGHYPQAANALNSLIGRRPSVTAYRKIGYVNFKMRRFKEAAASFQEALARGGEEVTSLNGVGVSLMAHYLYGGRDEIDQRNLALQAWRRSLRLRPKQPFIIDLLTRYQRL